MTDGRLELCPEPRERPSRRARVLLAACVLTPVTLLFLVPVMLGLERYAISTDAMGDALPRGSVAIERAVPLGDVAVGDVVTFERPWGGPGLVTRRVVALSDGALVTRGDALPDVDPWLVAPTSGTVSRVVLDVPYVGYPFLGTTHRWLWLVFLVVPASSLLGGLAWERLRRAERRREREPAPV